MLLDYLKLIIGRCERIRTFDPLHPMQVRYQAAPHTESLRIITSAINAKRSAWFEFRTILGEQFATAN